MLQTVQLSDRTAICPERQDVLSINFQLLMRRTNVPLKGSRVAVVGGGINGIMTAWRLAELGATVEVFERGEVMGETSRASTKLLHGGLRYLEQGAFHLVHESLHARTWWIEQAPQLAHPIQILLPVHKPDARPRGARPRWLVGLGLTMYDVLAGRHTFGRHQWHDAQELRVALPGLRTEAFLGGYTFFDAQMDDHALGLWAAKRAGEAGVTIHEQTSVDRLDVSGRLFANDTWLSFDTIVNAAGPWAERLLARSGISSEHALDLVRGSHLLLRGTIPMGMLVEVPGERRICFILPYQGHILVGTTEVRQTLDDPAVCSAEERTYLLDVYNAMFTDTRSDADIVETFAGIRPLLRSAANPTQASREYAIERRGRVVTVFGGKWTTSRTLARRVAKVVTTIRR